MSSAPSGLSFCGAEAATVSALETFTFDATGALTLILDTRGNVFGAFTPVEWESGDSHKCDASQKSFFSR
jgi:hypothetical protein